MGKPRLSREEFEDVLSTTKRFLAAGLDCADVEGYYKGKASNYKREFFEQIHEDGSYEAYCARLDDKKKYWAEAKRRKAEAPAEAAKEEPPEEETPVELQGEAEIECADCFVSEAVEKAFRVAAPKSPYAGMGMADLMACMMRAMLDEMKGMREAMRACAVAIEQFNGAFAKCNVLIEQKEEAK